MANEYIKSREFRVRTTIVTRNEIKNLGQNLGIGISGVVNMAIADVLAKYPKEMKEKRKF